MNKGDIIYDKKTRRCSCCGRIPSSKVLISLDHGSYVCFSCARKVNEIFTSHSYLKEEIRSMEDLGIPDRASDAASHPGEEDKFSLGEYTPRQIKAQLDQYIVGQEKAKELLAVACYNHYKRTKINNPDLDKSNVLLVGPTGSGKTFLVKTLARILDVPVAIVPATRLTEAGYIGDDVEVTIQNLLVAAGNDPHKAEHGIVFIDEIDKLYSSSSETHRTVGGKGVQQALLPLIEGCYADVPAASGSIAAAAFHATTRIDTTNILFICGGAFPELEDIVKNRLDLDKRKIGFSNGETTCPAADVENLLGYAQTEDFVKFGIIPELLGRLPVRAALEPLSVDLLRKILTEPKNSLVSQYRSMFAYDGVELVFESDALDYVAEVAYKENTGARALRTIMEQALQKLMFEVPGKKGIRNLLITKEYLVGQLNDDADDQIGRSVFST